MFITYADSMQVGSCSDIHGTRYAVPQAVEDRYGGGGWWGFLQMPFGDNNPNSPNWPVIPIQFSKQYYAMMQVSHMNLNKQHAVARVSCSRCLGRNCFLL